MLIYVICIMVQKPLWDRVGRVCLWVLGGCHRWPTHPGALRREDVEGDLCPADVLSLGIEIFPVQVISFMVEEKIAAVESP